MLCGMAQFDSYIRGYQAYQDTWTPVVREDTASTQSQIVRDRSAVAVMKEDISNCWTCSV